MFLLFGCLETVQDSHPVTIKVDFLPFFSKGLCALFRVRTPSSHAAASRLGFAVESQFVVSWLFVPVHAPI